MSESKNGKIRVGLLALPETTSSVLYGLFDLFSSVDRDWTLITRGQASESPFAPMIVAAEAQAFRTANGVLVKPDVSVADAGTPDIVCVPELLVPPDQDVSGWYPREVAWLRECSQAGSYLGTACSGALLLADAGLLKGREATTHWAYCDALARHHPEVAVRPRQALVIAGDGQRMIMVGGGSSWQDLGLYLIARLTDLERALQVAKIYLIDWHHVGQQPYAVLTRQSQAEDALIARCQSWLGEHYDEDHPVRRMTEISGLSDRSFKRRFRKATGMRPIDYVQALRLEEAKQCLESSDLPVEAIAEAVGYEDPGFFGRLFKRKVGITPAQYRRRFGALRQVLPDGPSSLSSSETAAKPDVREREAP